MVYSSKPARGILVFFLTLTASTSFGQFQVQLQEVVSGLDYPTFATHAGDGSGRLFICEQRGKIRILDPSGRLLPEPFLDLGLSGLDLVTPVGTESGLLGLAFHPDYAIPKSLGFGKFYVCYTNKEDWDPVVSQFTVSADPNVANSTATILMGPLFHPGSVHFGGCLAFNPQDSCRSCLYISRGDGGVFRDPDGNAQNIENTLGAILRVDVDRPSSGSNYGIPPDNPFVGAEGHDEIWAYGFRNPWRFSFDRETGRCFVGDVGQDKWEEVNEVAPGGNYGWNLLEGIHCYPEEVEGCTPEGTIPPIVEYPHSEGISIIGGYVYRGSLFPKMQGYYFYSDFISSRIWSLKENPEGGWDKRDEGTHTPFSLSSFAEDEWGELYLVRYSGGLSRIVNIAADLPQGDLNANRRVGPRDLVEFLRQARGERATSGHLSADLNSDEKIDLLDALEIQAHWRTPTAASR